MRKIFYAFTYKILFTLILITTLCKLVIYEKMNLTNLEINKFKGKHQLDKWIVVTTINEPTEQVKFLSNIDQFQLLVVGDKKTNWSWNCQNAIFLNIVFSRAKK